MKHNLMKNDDIPTYSNEDPEDLTRSGLVPEPQTWSTVLWYILPYTQTLSLCVV